MIRVGGYEVYPQTVYKGKIGKIFGVEEVRVYLGNFDLAGKIKDSDKMTQKVLGVQTTETFIAYPSLVNSYEEGLKITRKSFKRIKIEG